MTSMADRVTGAGLGFSAVPEGSHVREERTRRPPDAPPAQDRLDVSMEARHASEGIKASLPNQAPETARPAAPPADSSELTADTFGVDKAINVWPNLGVAEEGPIERPLLDAPQTRPDAPKPNRSDDHVAERAADRESDRSAERAAERRQPPRPVDVETQPGPASAERALSALPPGVRQDTAHSRIGGAVADLGGRSGTYLDTVG